ncbi:hypothetical protein MMC31_005039 [Peltigera leucophlebia]|nr:hypothetical protein [Peltigera leucophlebia]
MHLAIPFTLLMGSFVAAAPSIQHAQISVEVTNMDAQDQVDVLHPSDELVMNYGGPSDSKYLPFNFTLTAQYAQTNGVKLPFGFKDLNINGFLRGELGFKTEFAFRNGKLINGNRALGNHPSFIFPPWTTLWPLNINEPNVFYNLNAFSKPSGEEQHYFIEFSNPSEIFGAFEIKHGQPIFVGPIQEFGRARLVLAVEPIPSKAFDGINEDSAKELL